MNKATRELLEQHFDTAFAAPDGVKKLRELILTLAMQGKLVAQDPNDEPSSELLNKLEKERGSRRRESANGNAGKAKSLPPINPLAVPYLLPQGWEWVRLGMVSDINGGFAFKSSKYSNDGVRVVRISDFDEKGFKDEKIVRYPYTDDLRNYSLELNNILMAMTGGTVGKSLWVKSMPEPMVVNQRVATIKMASVVIPEFINGLIRTNLIQSVIQAAKNSTNDNISMGDIAGFLVPLPPLPEQKRIVTKIEQLMARCDELEKLCAEREQRRLTVHAAAINRLTSPTASFPRRRESMTAENLASRTCALEDMRGNVDGMGSLNEAWQFITQHFAELYAVKPNVAELRKAILQLAVMGKLVSQDPNDPPASELLKEIEAEKQRLVKEGAIKVFKPLPQVRNDEQEFELPCGWVWSRLQNVLDVRDGTHDSPKYVVGPNTYPLVTSKNFVDGMIDFSGARRISAEDHFEIIKRFMEHLAINLQTKAAGGAQPFVSLGFLRNLVIALPPLSEQQRIVAKIDSLMALCDTLEQQIDAATSKQTALLNAVMSQV